ncbi:MAG: lipocalin family protein [bacterium]
MKRFSLIVLLLYFIVAENGCSTGPQPQPTAGVNCYFTQSNDLPQTQSAAKLAEFMSQEHLEYDLDGWFFFGSLVDSASPEAPGMFISSMQRIAKEWGGIRWQLIPAIIAYNGPSLEGYVFGGDFILEDLDPRVVVTSNPWKVTVNSSKQTEPLMTMSLVSGTMGQAGAEYLLTGNVPALQGGTLEAEVLLCDRLGTVNQGYGSASFFPQYLTGLQQYDIKRSFGNSVKKYLESTGASMAGQGSFYYSLPLLDVKNFWIKRNGVLLSSGTSGTMWMDDIVQSYGQEAQDVLIGKAWWEFYSIMLPEEDAAIMVIQIKSGTGTLPVATLFSTSSERTSNSARKPVHSWKIDEIGIEALSSGGVWTSPMTGNQYVQERRIRLESPDCQADLTVKMVREDQEIVVDMTAIGLNKTIKYEGLATVTGTLRGKPVRGTAVVELQPFGSQ